MLDRQALGTNDVFSPKINNHHTHIDLQQQQT